MSWFFLLFDLKTVYKPVIAFYLLQYISFLAVLVTVNNSDTGAVRLLFQHPSYLTSNAILQFF